MSKKFTEKEFDKTVKDLTGIIAESLKLKLKSNPSLLEKLYATELIQLTGFFVSAGYTCCLLDQGYGEDELERLSKATVARTFKLLSELLSEEEKK